MLVETKDRPNSLKQTVWRGEKKQFQPHQVLFLALTWWSVGDVSGSCMQNDAHVYQPFWYCKNHGVAHSFEPETHYLPLLTDEGGISVWCSGISDIHWLKWRTKNRSSKQRLQDATSSRNRSLWWHEERTFPRDVIFRSWCRSVKNRVELATWKRSTVSVL